MAEFLAVALSPLCSAEAREQKPVSSSQDGQHCHAVVCYPGARPYTVWPPSMTKACPMTKAAISEHSQSTAAAISSGLPIRPIGFCAITRAKPSGYPR